MRVGTTVPLAYGDVVDGRAPTFAETVTFAQLAEQVGLDSIWVYDHLIFKFPPEPDEGLHEAWTILSALAPVVPRVELGTLVMCTSFRNAGLMAKMAATLDTISDGRLILGMGAGWHEPEYTSFGYPFDHLVGRFEEDIEVIDRLLRGETVDFEGKWSHYAGAQLLPAPARKTPVLIASKGERMLRLTARWADAWNTAWYGRVDDTLLERTASVDAALDAAGRDRKSLRKTIGVRLHEPGQLGDDAKGTDADAAGLADLFDELDAFGYQDALVWAVGKTTAAVERLGQARELHLARR
ncbi:MAG TPA: LLM class flavin-dependent oxidoreductase [Candidatus Limnocylindrales bacterium]|jgi:alkanesulfonate monooxygenase SsuD/methylene tetrahydromethanopterin reductase-like flavin-dependent oxidoreductase (luciferase family)